MAVGLAVAGPAAALQGAEVIAAAARALETRSVYLDPDARNVLSQADADRIEQRIRERNADPIYIAILPATATQATAGDPTGVVREIAARVDRPGVYAAVVGRSFRAGTTGGVLPVGTAGRLAGEALAAHRTDGLAAVLLDFVDRVAAARHRATDSGGGAPSPWWLLALGAGGAGGYALWRRSIRRRRDEETAQLAEVKEVARDDMVALGDEIRALELDVEMPGASAEAKSHYNTAVYEYRFAADNYDKARRPEDLRPVSEAMERGRYQMTAARNLLEGRPVPERRIPCFFDPRHGPSVRDVDWAPQGGTPRPVPVCEMDAQRIEQGDEPAVREVQYAGGSTPYWNAPAAYTPWFGGFFGGFGLGGFLPGLLVGQMMAGGFGAGAEEAYADQGAGTSDSGGDFGGGGDMGGDFGGGDFGGGGDF